MKEHEDLPALVGNNINRLRKAQGMSFQELAHQCDMEKAYLIKMANQGKNITLNTLQRIAKSLNVPVEELLKKE